MHSIDPLTQLDYGDQITYSTPSVHHHLRP